MSAPETFAWKVYANGNRRVWYDRHYRLWVMQTVDAEGNQEGDVQYERRGPAMRWLNNETKGTL